MTKNRIMQLGMAGALLFSLTFPIASHARDFIKDTSHIGKSNGVIVSDQLLELGVVRASSLRLQGEQLLRVGRLHRAVTVLQRAVEMSPVDMDGRILYATALEKMLVKQKKRDPKLYNFVIKQWFYISKNADFGDQKDNAKNHLVNLTGKRPKWYENEKRYLSKVLIPEDGSVKVAFGGSKTQ